MGLIGEIFADAGLHVDTTSFAQYGSELKKAEGNIGNFAASSQALIAGAFALPAVAVAGITGYGVMVASSMQDASASLTTVYGDLDVAKEKFQWLQGFAASTPFEFPELLDATVKLKGYGIEAQDYMGTIGDASAAMGKSLNQTTEAVADAMTGEFERLKEFGIKATVITESNAKQLGASLSDVGRTALAYTSKSGEEQIKVVDRSNKEMVLSSIQSIWDVEKGFKGAMETRSKTMSGMWSTIKDNFSMGLADMVGFKDMEVQTLSLMSVLMSLAGVAVYVSGAFSGMGEPAQAFVLIAALGGSAALALSGALMAASLAGITTAGVMGALAIAVNAVLWPAVAIVAGLALLGAGLVYLEEKTGLVSATWQIMKDVFIIVVDAIGNAAGRLHDWIVQKMDEISQAISNMIPPGVASAIGGTIDWINSKFGSMASDIHTQAVSIQGDNKNTAASTTQVGTAYTTAGASAKGAGTGFNAAAGGLANTNTQARAAAGGLNSVTQAALNAVNATKQLWSAQQQIASQAMTIRQAQKTVDAGYGTSSGKGNYDSKTGVTVIKSGTANSEYNQKVAAVNNYNSTTNITNNQPTASNKKAQLAVIGRS